MLLTLKDIADVRQNPAPYSLPIILRPLPSEIVDWENFITTDLLHLISGSASSSMDPEAVILGQKLVARTRRYRLPLLVRVPVSLNPLLVGATGVAILSAFP